jgi:hypothetical protein
MAWRKGRRGRPRKHVKRPTTLAGRRPAIDHGSPELVQRKIHVANGSTAPVELVDVVGVLFANELIVDEELIALRLVAEWLTALARVFHLPQASPGGLWSALQARAGQTGGWWTAQLGGGNVPGANRAKFRLDELFDHFTAIDQLEVLRLIIRIAGNEAGPSSAFELAKLRYGAQLVMQLQRRGRHAVRRAGQN